LAKSNDDFHAPENEGTGDRAAGAEALNPFRDIPAEGPLLPYLARVSAGNRATEFRSRCRQLGIEGGTLHSYRYAWVERALKCGYLERFAMDNLGHNSKAVHRAYAKRELMKLPSLGEYVAKANSEFMEPETGNVPVVRPSCSLKAWRGKARELCSLLEIPLPDKPVEPAEHVKRACCAAAGAIRPKMLDGEAAREAIGPRWAFYVTEFIRKISDSAVPFMIWDFATRQLASREMLRICREKGQSRQNYERQTFYESGGEILSAREYRQKMAEIPENVINN